MGEDEEIGNYTCVLRHLWYLDHNNDLDLHAMINKMETYPGNEWLKDQHIQDHQTCYEMTQNIPRHNQPFVEEGKPNMAKIQFFFKCLSGGYRNMYAPRHQGPDRAQFWTCGPSAQADSATEVELYRLVFELIYRDTLDFF